LNRPPRERSETAGFKRAHPSHPLSIPKLPSDEIELQDITKKESSKESFSVGVSFGFGFGLGSDWQELWMAWVYIQSMIG